MDYPVTVKDLIGMLEKWDQDKEFDVFVQNNPDKGPSPIVILGQQTNTIRLN